MLRQCHRLDQRAYHFAGGRTLYQGRRSRAHGAGGHGGHNANKNWQRRETRCQIEQKILRFQRSELGMAGVEGLEPQPPVLEFGNSDDIVYYFVLISPKNQPLSSLGSRLDAVQFGPVLSSWVAKW